MEKKVKEKVTQITGTDDLRNTLAKTRRELLELRFQKAAQQLPNGQKIKQTRRELARILTAINKKEK